jgi:polyphosphate kinase 2 (PPK2 family)
VGKKSDKKKKKKKERAADVAENGASNGETLHAVHPSEAPDFDKSEKLTEKKYQKELEKYHIELAKFQSWVKATG